MTKTSPRWFIVTFALASAAFVSLGCSSSGGTGATFPSGEVIGPPDTHCSDGYGGLMIKPIGVCQVIDPARAPSNESACGVGFTQDAGIPAPTEVDAGADAGAPTSDYGPIMYGSAGNDDDCKYYLSWTSTPIQEHSNTYFTVTAIRLADMKPATCAGIIPDVSLAPAADAAFSTHGLPGLAKPSPEIIPGVYQVGPIPFDEAGIWIVRFHLFEECSDSPDSPHGHAAFYVKVP